VTAIAENIAALSQEIRSLERDAQRPEGSVILLAVSKRHSSARIREVAAAGQLHFGENYLQEAESKITELADLDLVWHFIGPIQSNKTRGIAAHFDWVHSVDRLKIAQRLSEQRPAAVAPLNICVQVNVSDEHSKSGVTDAEVAKLCEQIDGLPNIRLRGLMAIPAALDDYDLQRASFRQLATLYASLRTRHPDMDTLSMGMSNDFAAAIAEGSTMVRIGTAIFGARD
jgi:pyridoxal phosphate enzyme (YggS family)